MTLHWRHGSNRYTRQALAHNTLDLVSRNAVVRTLPVCSCPPFGERGRWPKRLTRDARPTAAGIDLAPMGHAGWTHSRVKVASYGAPRGGGVTPTTMRSSQRLRATPGGRGSSNRLEQFHCISPLEGFSIHISLPRSLLAPTTDVRVAADSTPWPRQCRVGYLTA